jgi:hypothetical protein
VVVVVGLANLVHLAKVKVVEAEEEVLLVDQVQVLHKVPLVQQTVVAAAEVEVTLVLDQVAQVEKVL